MANRLLLSSVDLLPGNRAAQFTEAEAEQRSENSPQTCLQTRAEPAILAQEFRAGQQEVRAFRDVIAVAAAMAHFDVGQQQDLLIGPPNLRGEVRIAAELTVALVDLA